MPIETFKYQPVFANQKASGSSFDAEFKFLGKELDVYYNPKLSSYNKS